MNPERQAGLNQYLVHETNEEKNLDPRSRFLNYDRWVFDNLGMDHRILNYSRFKQALNY